MSGSSISELAELGMSIGLLVYLLFKVQTLYLLEIPEFKKFVRSTFAL